MQDVICTSREDNRLANTCRRDLHIIVQGFTRQMGLSSTDTEDCTQECLLRLWGHFGSMLLLSRAMQEKRGWILLCTKHQVINYRRICWRRMECQDEIDLSLTWVAPEPSPDAIVLSQELDERIAICLQKLKPEQCVLLMRHYLFEETCAEIATSQGITTHALEQRLLRYRCKLRQFFIDAGISEAEAADYFAANVLPSTPYVIR